MPKLINVLTGVTQECDFVRYQLDEKTKQAVDQIVSIIKGIDKQIDFGTDSRQINLNLYRKVPPSADSMTVSFNLLYVCLMDLIRSSGKHRINGYFWYISESYPGFEVSSLTNDPTNSDEIPVVYYFETRELSIRFSVNNTGIEYPTTGKLLC